MHKTAFLKTQHFTFASCLSFFALLTSLMLLMGFISPTAYAQEAPESNILRLEDTIRGNKEQPQVLTIVPWQLPAHQRINENKEWKLKVSKLPEIERSAFLRHLALVKELAQNKAGGNSQRNSQQDASHNTTDKEND